MEQWSKLSGGLFKLFDPVLECNPPDGPKNLVATTHQASWEIEA